MSVLTRYRVECAFRPGTELNVRFGVVQSCRNVHFDLDGTESNAFRSGTVLDVNV